MAKLVDALDLGSNGANCKGSSPFIPTMINFIKPYKLIERDNNGIVRNKIISYEINIIPTVRFQYIGNERWIKLAWLCWGINIMWRKKEKC